MNTQGNYATNCLISSKRKIVVKVLVYGIISIATCLLISYMSGQDKTISYEISGAITDATAWAVKLPVNDENDSFKFIYTLELIYRKLAHVSLYFMLGLSVTSFVVNMSELRKAKVTLWSVILFCFLFSIVDELHQNYVPGRTCSVRDIVFDGSGYLLSVYLFKVIGRAIEKKRFERRRKNAKT